MALELSDVALKGRARSLVDGVTFSLQRGKILAVVGPNGAGKSSLLKGILGLLPLARGCVLVDGQTLPALGAEERAKRMAYVPQQSALDAPLPVEQVVSMGRFVHGRSRSGACTRDRDVVAQVLARCGAQHLASRSFLTLSGGERGRVLLARALATEARLLLLDEPTHALDVAQTLDCLALLRNIADRGQTIVMVTHDLNQVSTTADQILLMHQGRMVARGTPDLLLRGGLAESVFGVRLVPCGAYAYARHPQQARTGHA